MAMVADYSFELTSIETYAPQFIGYNKIFLGSVSILKRACDVRVPYNMDANNGRNSLFTCYISNISIT